MLATSLAPKPSEGKTLARLPDGGDTDQSGITFVIADFPTSDWLMTPSPRIVARRHQV